MKPIFQGGLMRCCLKTLAEHIDSGGSEEEGTIVKCKYCGVTGGAVVRNGRWEWKDLAKPRGTSRPCGN